MADTHIVALPDSLDLTNSGLITGRIFFDMGGVIFPSEDWDDFIVVLLGWWISSILQLVEGHVDETELRFMDGPYVVQAERESEGVLCLQCVARGSPVCDGIQVRGDTLLAEIISVSAKILKACEAKGWRSEDIEKLERDLTLARSSLGLR
jgi:hypothetical protein